LARNNFHFEDNTSIEVNILSYNIFLRPPFIKNNADDFKNERLEGFIENVIKKGTFHVIALQEIFRLGNMRQQYLLQAAREAGYTFHARSIDPPLFSKKFIDAGLLILSKFPIVERDSYIYTLGHQIDSWAAKQVVYANIQLNQKQHIHLFTTHMQASYFDSSTADNHKNDRARLCQVDDLCNFVHSKIHNSPFPAVVAGDFNIHALKTAGQQQQTGDYEDRCVESQEYLYLINKLNKDSFSCSPAHLPARDLLKEANNGNHPVTYADVCPRDMKPRETVLTDPVDHGSQLCIDHILFVDTVTNCSNRSITVKPFTTRVEEFFVSDHRFTQLSDHYGVSTTLVINPLHSESGC
jgi:endonuclease/exonuclease/phosphatase family metal-dependent hydrolase